ncbi:MAG: cyclase family protein [Chitinophagales bacterium]|nr:cyclase family protein [Chitinophagales bacterium]
MTATIQYNNQVFQVDFSKPLDISLPVKPGGVKAWYVNEPTFEPVSMGDWIGEVRQGGSVDFKNIFFNPHGHGTHTECVGHISKEFYSVNDSMKQFMFMAKLITVMPQNIGHDKIITSEQIKRLVDVPTEAIVIRTLANDKHKMTKNYSQTNPPFLEDAAIYYLSELGVSHLLIDTPSVDKEVDGGALKSHHAFWNYPNQPNVLKTITELIYVDDSIHDGSYLLDLQVAAFENDAAPSRPILYKIF